MEQTVYDYPCENLGVSPNIVLSNGDSARVLEGRPSESVDMVLTSPPYDNARAYKGFTWDFEKIATELARVLKPGGVIVWVVADQTIKGSESGSSMRQALFFKDKCGLRIHDTMIYRKDNYIPLTHNRYEQEWEYMYCFSKGSPKTFNPIYKKNKLAGKTYNTRRPMDYDNHALRHNTDRVRTYKEFGIRGNIFSYVRGCDEDKHLKGKHPAPFPNQLAIDQVKSWSNEKELILDPFMGSGTTGVAAKILGREFWGIEISKEYTELSKERILRAKYQQPTNVT